MGSNFTGSGIGFTLDFENGYSVSIGWGNQNLCEHHRVECKDGEGFYSKFRNSKDAEIVITNDNTHAPIVLEDSVVLGHMDTFAVAQILAIVSSARCEADIHLEFSKFKRKQMIRGTFWKTAV